MLRWFLSIVRHMGRHHSPTQPQSSRWLSDAVKRRGILTRYASAGASNGVPPSTFVQIGSMQRGLYRQRRSIQHRHAEACESCVEPFADNTATVPSTYPARDRNLRSGARIHHDTSLSFTVTSSTGLADNDVCAPSPVIPDNRRAIYLLRGFLSSANISSSNPRLHSPNTLRSLYQSAKSRSQLSELDLSSLLSFFGSLSVVSNNHSKYSGYMHPLATKVKCNVPRTYWPLVREIAREKKRLGGGLNDRDRYWILLSELGDANIFDGKRLTQSNFHQRSSAVLRAKAQYLRIYRHTADPEVHVPYFRALLSFRTLEHLTDAVNLMCELLGRHGWCHTRLLRVLWEIVLKPGVDIPVHLQMQILSALWARVRMFHKGVIRPRHSLERSATNGTYGTWNGGVATLCTNFVNAIFSCGSSHTSPHLHQWAIATAQDVFSPEVPYTARWGNFVLLAMFHAPFSTGVPQSLHGSDHTDPATISWQVVCALSTVEKSLCTIISLRKDPELMDKTRSLVRTLWRNWSTVSDDSAPPVLVVGTIVASFLRVSAVLRDVQLKDACQRYCTARGLWDCKVRPPLTVEYALASVACGARQWDKLAVSLDSALSRDTIDAIISRIMSQDPEFAYQGFLFMNRIGFQLSTRTANRLALGLVFSGRIDCAVPFFTNQRFLRWQNERLLGAVLRTLARLGTGHVNEELVVVLGSIMRALYGKGQWKPPECLRARIQHILPVMATSGHSSEAMGILKDIQLASPDYFSMSFIHRFVRVLLAQRQFDRAFRLLDLLMRTRSHYVNYIGPILVFGLATGGASRLATRANRKLVDSNVRPSRRQALAHDIMFRLKAPSQVLALNMIPTLDRFPNELDAIRFAIHVLVRAGHIRAANNLFNRVYPALDQTWLTSIGNILLHGTLLRVSHGNGRQMRKLLATLDIFVKKYGFVSDRVTINILIKAITRWRSVISSNKLRALFDHMIRSGYPAGQYGSSGRMPFETPLSSPQVFHLPTLPAVISFERHVRPLYRMFITAFYVRGDAPAARVVVGILKWEEMKLNHRP